MKSYLLIISFIVICFSCNKRKAELDIINDKKLIASFMSNVPGKWDRAYLEDIKKLTAIYNRNPSPVTKHKLDSMSKIVFTKGTKLYNSYLDIYDKTEVDKHKILEMVNFVLLTYKETAKIEKWGGCNVVHYSEVNNYPQIKSSKMYINLEYEALDNVYFGFFNEDPDWVTLFVAQHDKIISFFPHMVFGVGATKPYLLNEKP